MARSPIFSPAAAGNLLVFPTICFLLVFMIWPIGQMLSLAFLDSASSFTFNNVGAALFSPTVLRTSTTTLSIALISAVLCTLIAYPIALYLSRRTGRVFALLMIMVLIPFWISVLVRTIAWFLVFGQNGVINGTLTSLGLTGEAWQMLYTRGAVITGIVHAIAPISVLTILGAMQNVDPRLAAASASLGASPARHFWLVYFPLTKSGVAASFILAFVLSLGIFVQPTLLGSPRETMIAQVIIQQIDELFNWNMAAAIAIVFLVLALLIVVIADRLFGISLAGRPTRQAGTRRGPLHALQQAVSRRVLLLLAALTGPFFGSDAPTPPGKARARFNTTAILAVIGLIWLAAPALFLIPVSFTDSNFLEWPPRGFSLRWYEAYFTSPIWIDATLRSIIVGLVTASVSIVLGIPAAMALSRGEVSAKPLVMGLVLLSLAIPNILLALAMFYVFSTLGLVGTDLGLVIGQTVFAVPYVIVAMVAAFGNYNWQLNTAAGTLGAGGLRTFWMITMPIVRVGVASSFVFAFIRSFEELSVAMFISSGLSTTLPKRIWSEAHFNISPTLAAVSTVLIIGVTTIVLSVEFFTRRAKATTQKGMSHG